MLVGPRHASRRRPLLNHKTSNNTPMAHDQRFTRASSSPPAAAVQRERSHARPRLGLAEAGEDAPNLPRALLGRALLPALVVDVAHAEARLVALGPLEVAAAPCQPGDRREEDGGEAYSIRLQAM